ncbi:hypothetical protein HK104_002500 [Borealophlyctis nickersoniae]|nr:hypothetical protein HK104_002500 [Borealophlyctis nickersoniae]
MDHSKMFFSQQDGTKLFSGGCDKAGKLMDLNTGQIMQVAGHDAPIRCARWINHGNMNDIVVTGSWDKSLRYWDLRSPTPAAVVPLTERVYTMDVNSALLVLGTADRKISMFNVQNPTQVYREVESPLKFQTRVVSCFINAKGFAVGSIEGRVGIQYVEAADQHLNFSFKCHRDDRNVYSVNAISFHPLHGTFATAGADGGFNFWDKDSKQRLKQWESCGQTISCSTFNRTGNIYAYAASYDWSKGVEGRQPNSKDAIFLHAVKDEDIKPRVAKPTTKR